MTAFPYFCGEGVSKFVGGLSGHNLAAKGGIEGCLSGRLVRPGRASTAFLIGPHIDTVRNRPLSSHWHCVFCVFRAFCAIRASLLQEPEVCFAESGEFFFAEVRNYLCDHLRVFDGDGQILLLNRLPIHPAELVDLVKKGTGFVHAQFFVLGGRVIIDLLQFQFDWEEEIVSARLIIAGIVIQQEFVVREPDYSAALRHKARVFSIESDIIRCLSFIDGDDIYRDRETEFIQHIRNLRRIPFFHRLIIMNDYTVGITALNNEMAQCLTNIAHKAVKVIISIAVEVLENTFIIEAESTTNVSLTNLLGLECPDTYDNVVTFLACLQLPGDATYLGKYCGFDIGKMELECILARVLVVNSLRGDPFLQQHFLDLEIYVVPLRVRVITIYWTDVESHVEGVVIPLLLCQACSYVLDSGLN